MANYKRGYFVIPVSPTDQVVKIKDKFGDIRFSINPLQVTILYVTNNLVNVKSGNNLIKLDFADNDEAKIAITELQRQIDIIKNRAVKETAKKEELITQLDTDGLDFVSIYKTGATASSGTASGTTSVLENRLGELVKSISKDIHNLKVLDSTRNSNFVKINMSPVGLFSRSNQTPCDVLQHAFSDSSDGMVNVYINGLYLDVGNSIEDICHFSADMCVTCSNAITPESVLYINPGLLGYDLEPSDIITITYIKK